MSDNNNTVGKVTIKSRVKSFGGYVIECSHESQALSCSMNFVLYLPSKAYNDKKPCPLLYFLSGLTCTEQNFITKAGAIKYASQHNIILVCPDTSPRGDDVPSGKAGEWDFGKGAGFYLNALVEPYNKNYHMYDYITKELPSHLVSSFKDEGWIELINENLPKQSIFGHSMGGLGALVCYLRNPSNYLSCSAFAPICHPSRDVCAWGQKAFKGYLGEENKEVWKTYDPTEIVKALSNNSEQYQLLKQKPSILIDQGSDDKFLPQQQLLPEVSKTCYLLLN
ncbi:hypothetical protein ABK040_001642 [Willaertia magna]